MEREVELLKRLILEERPSLQKNEASEKRGNKIQIDHPLTRVDITDGDRRAWIEGPFGHLSDEQTRDHFRRQLRKEGLRSTRHS